MNTRAAIYLAKHEVVTIVRAVTRCIGYHTIADPEHWQGTGEHWRYELDQRTALARAVAANHWATRSDDDRDYSVIRLGMILGARSRIERDVLHETLMEKAS